MSDDVKRIAVAMDGMWEVCDAQGFHELGTVRRFDAMNGEFPGWGFALRHAQTHHGVRSTIYLGATIPDVPVKHFQVDGETVSEPCLNYGIPEKLIEGAVRGMANNQMAKEAFLAGPRSVGRRGFVHPQPFVEDMGRRQETVE